jgi:hypothetical protein
MDCAPQSDRKRPSFDDAVGRLNADYFFREFAFSTNTFKPDPRSELELADKIVWLDDLLIVCQIKERKAPADTSAEKERKWFSDEVAKKATRQIRDTLSYFQKYTNIELRNNRGDASNIARAQVVQMHKIVIYNPHASLPTECLFRKFHRSKSAGVIHVVHAEAYLGILRALVTPVEIAEYLSFRETLINKWGDALSHVSERAVVGQYLRNLPKEKPSFEFVKFVDELEEKNKDWDIARIIHLFFDRQNTPEGSRETGYRVLKQLGKLYRTEMGEFKKRFHFSMQKALADEPCLPHRFTSSRGCGFVFIPLNRKDLRHRRNYLLNFTVLNKYDQKLDRCIGLTFIAEGEGGWCDVQWCTLEFPWKEDSDVKTVLAACYPFRPVKRRVVERYGLSDAPKSKD